MAVAAVIPFTGGARNEKAYEMDQQNGKKSVHSSDPVVAAVAAEKSNSTGARENERLSPLEEKAALASFERIQIQAQSNRRLVRAACRRSQAAVAAAIVPRAASQSGPPTNPPCIQT